MDEIVKTAVQNLNKQFDRDNTVHTGIGNSKRSLKTFKDSFTITVKLSDTFFFTNAWDLNPPPEMRCKVHSTTLVWFLQ
ncbi:hypothetical protein WICPIJ_007255 [Wickerhamomyces pijperi]|uniref:Uncharacterized protein n=1 Tax=Wickerhamomyces pijperi TaxID=599730 RepID=A0A9P8TKA0_WICPI|nr:hypothetical protein WICPIJ_007255 [Wickerhamomyces pijperi]